MKIARSRKKIGGPRKFDKNVFLEKLSGGLSRKKACQQMGVSIKTVSYHMARDRRFKSKVNEAKRFSQDKRDKDKIEKAVEKIRREDELFEKCMDPSTKYPFKYYLLYTSEVQNDTWGQTITKILEWYKWARPEEKWFFMMLFCKALEMETKIDEEYRSVVEENRAIVSSYGNDGPPFHVLVRLGTRLRKALASHRPHYAEPSQLPPIQLFFTLAEEFAKKHLADQNSRNL